MPFYCICSNSFPFYTQKMQILFSVQFWEKEYSKLIWILIYPLNTKCIFINITAIIKHWIWMNAQKLKCLNTISTSMYIFLFLEWQRYLCIKCQVFFSSSITYVCIYRHINVFITCHACSIRSIPTKVKIYIHI